MASRLVMLAVVMAVARTAAAQTADPRFEVSATFVTTSSGQFHTKDVGVGGRLGWRLASALGIEGELTYQSDPFSDGVAFSAGRVEGLFGATLGPRLGPLRPFVMVRPGFVKYRASDEPLACIAIFPPPLSCTLAGGRTLFAADVGGGLEVAPTARTLLRADLSDRVVRYPSPAVDTSGMRHDGSFAGHDLRFGLSAGIRF